MNVFLDADHERTTPEIQVDGRDVQLHDEKIVAANVERQAQQIVLRV
ncbi:MAG: hypothetical protein IT494_02755 [Gammaproteobacteria bacterium]|nr:hypothetical protein [Gammaproteobacteria bacterium]